MKQQSHSKALQNSGDALANLSRAHNACGAPMKVKAQQAIKGKVPFAYLIKSAMKSGEFSRIQRGTRRSPVQLRNSGRSHAYRKCNGAEVM